MHPLTFKKYSFSGLVVMTLFLSSPFLAVEKSGRVAAAFLEINPGVRQSALGGDQVAAVGDVESFYANPASLSSLERPEIWMTHVNSYLDSTRQSLAFGLPFKRWSFGFSGQYSDAGKIKRTTNYYQAITESDTFRPYSAVLQYGQSVRLWRGLSWGLSAKAYRQELDRTDETSWAGDTGFLFKDLLPHFDAGLAYRNLGPKLDDFALPSSWAAGFGANFPYRWLKPLHFFGEYDYAEHRRGIVRSGMEFKFRRFWLRGGHHKVLDNALDQIGQFSVGGGIRFGQLSLNYAFKEASDLNNQHQFSVSYGFGLTTEERAEADLKMNKMIAQRMEDRSKNHVRLAEDAFNQNNFALSAKELTHALMWTPNDVTIKTRLEKVQGLDKAAQSEKLAQEGKSLLSQNRWIDAALLLHQASLLDPDNKRIQALLQQANSKIKSTNVGSKNRLQNEFDRGTHYYIKGEFNSALKTWDGVLNENPHWPNIQEYVAKAQAKVLGKELESQKRSSEGEGRYIDILTHNAYTFYTLGDKERALDSWKKVAALDPTNKDAQWGIKELQADGPLNVSQPQPRIQKRVNELNMKALQEYSGGRLVNAMTFWRECLVLDPQNQKVRNNLQRVENELAFEGSKP